MLPPTMWAFFIVANTLMIPLNLALEQPGWVALNVLSGLSCWGGYYISKQQEEKDDKRSR
tara:strand:- start:361 stop:540 length:180 start_codon:yes stop_codon:yes gene_type:complete